MKVYNRVLFHCLCCGRVVRAESDDKTPDCCDQRMTNAAAETVVEAEQCDPSNVAASGGDEAKLAKNRPIPR